MKRALVCGAGGFIGGDPSASLRAGLVKKLKRQGYWVRGVDIKEHEFAPTAADEFLLLDLREPGNCRAALTLRQPFTSARLSTSDWAQGRAQGRLLPDGDPSTGSPPLDAGTARPGSGQAGQAFDEVYQLAADMGGMGFISVTECEVLRNNALINIHMTHAAAEMGVPRYFFSSSVCVYRDMQPGEPALTKELGSRGAGEQRS